MLFRIYLAFPSLEKNIYVSRNIYNTLPYLISGIGQFADDFSEYIMQEIRVSLNFGILGRGEGRRGP